MLLWYLAAVFGGGLLYGLVICLLDALADLALARWAPDPPLDAADAVEAAKRIINGG